MFHGDFLSILVYFFVTQICSNVESFFDDVFEELKCEPATKAYIKSIFSKYKDARHDLSKESVTIVFANAKQRLDFSSFQNLADWIFFMRSFAPDHLSSASEEYYETVARLSYYRCYLLINKQWKLFEEMSDNFVCLENQTRSLLSKNLNQDCRVLIF